MRARTNRNARREKARHQLARDKRCDHRLVTVRHGEITCELVAGHTGHHRWTIPDPCGLATRCALCRDA